MMSDTANPGPIGPCPDPITQVVTVEQLATRLGVRPGTIRQHLHAGVAWLPRPDGTINGGAVWRASTLAGIESRKPRRGERPARASDPAPSTPPSEPPAPQPAAPAPDRDDTWWE